MFLVISDLTTAGSVRVVSNWGSLPESPIARQRYEYVMLLHRPRCSD